MTAKEFLETCRSVPQDKIDLETGEGYMVIVPKDFGAWGNLIFSPLKFQRQFVKVVPYNTAPKREGVMEVVDGVEVEFRDAPNYLVVGAPENPRGFKYLRICGDFAMWSRTNSAPF